jgi:16S rRNA (cytosine967-C5)-methyltransferase
MTPAARLSAAIEVLDAWLAGTPAEPALKAWGRASRYAGSGDRAGVRDHVYDAIRCRRSFAWAGGAATGRGLMLGALRLAGQDPAALFTGAGHAPAPVSDDEAGRPLDAAPAAVRLDCPDWLLPLLEAALGAEAVPALEAGRSRAPVWLRVNEARTSTENAVAILAAEGIAARPHPNVKTALEVTDNERKVSTSSAYLDGLVEVQDASSQAVVAALGEISGLRVLD